jgi:dTMP kinase
LDRAGEGVPGIFITIEGPDGAGKSRQLATLVTRIGELGRAVVATREPGGTDFGERIRALLLEASAYEHDPWSDALLFNAARSRLVGHVIRPALERGAVVVCDRFTDSTLAYQGYGAGLPVDELRALADFSTGALVPARTVLIDVTPAEGLARRQSGAAYDMTRFELADAHGLAYHERVRNGYLELAAAEPDRWRVVDGAGTPPDVAARVWDAVADLFA